MTNIKLPNPKPFSLESFISKTYKTFIKKNPNVRFRDGRTGELIITK